jgi:acyl-coenzyme A synthetase/AMP-(fatty) acid ligase
VPIGGPLDHVQVYALDGQRRMVPFWVTGELYIGGVGLARGYLHQPALTAARFVPDPFGEERGARLYRTGDRVHRRADGELIFLGRADHQVKLHGYRIELSEVEAVIARHPRVVAAAVAVREPSPGQPLLVAYVVGDVDEDALRAFAATQLPDYMLPARVVRVTQLPLSANGKIDRRALPPLSTALPPSPPPADDAFAGMWADVLGRAGAASRSPRADRADTQEPPS